MNKLFANIKNNFTYQTCFSDHLCVSVTLDIGNQIQVARPLWRLNVSLLENKNIQSNFYRLWYLLQRKNKFTNIVQWWEMMVKPHIKIFYINQGKEEKSLKQGRLKYFESNLRNLYEQCK